ncbi:MAG: ribosome maturation factor RimP [Pseudorhodobacter sp.]|nr:ribosome maturation factor RimP [Rhizobacter sp.]
MTWQTTVETTVTGLGYDLVDAERSPRGLLRVFIDHLQDVENRAQAAAVITVEDCEKVTRQLQHVLEVENWAYERLEVSSPGLDRPLKKASDYQRFVGEQIEVTLKVPFQGRKKYKGVLLAKVETAAEAAGEGWRMVLAAPEVVVPKGTKKPAPPPEQALDFLLEEVREARLVPVVDFKGRRFAPPAADNGAHAPQQLNANVELDGDRKQ